MRPRGCDLTLATVLVVVSLINVFSNTRLGSPPRYDGSGYAILAESIRTRGGYREITHPDAPRHAHFPPGYPAALAGIWSISGRSFAVAHGFSIVCTVLAIVLFWRWFATMYRAPIAFTMGLALAVNWTWGRIGGAIQSEPLFMMWLGIIVHLVLRRARFLRCDRLKTVALGVALACATLTRHVGICVVAAVMIPRIHRRAWRGVFQVGAIVIVMLIPWAIWLKMVGRQTQVSLIPRAQFGSLIADQSLFYLRRIPDQIIGPCVEVATVFGRSGWLSLLATVCAGVFTAVIVYGWICALRSTRRRFAALVPLCTLPMLLIWPFTEAGRFLIPLLPFILVGGIEGFGALLARFRRLPKPKLQASQFLLILSLPYSVYAMASGRVAAQERTHADFDAACGFLAKSQEHPGPVLSRHPGDVYWLAGRQGLEPPQEVEAILQVIHQYKVTYLLLDEARYAKAEASPLARFVAIHPELTKRVWEGRSAQVYEVITSQAEDRQK